MSPTSYNPDIYQDEAAPAYEESLDASRFTHSEEKKDMSHFAPSLSLGKQLAETRARRIEDMLETYVNPLVFSLGQTGLYKTTFLLVPSNVTVLQTNRMSKETEIIGFPAGCPASLIWLIGEEHTLEFWRQPAVMKELESCLKQHLIGTGHSLEGTMDEASTRITERPEDDNNMQISTAAKKSFWGKTNTRAISRKDYGDAETIHSRPELRRQNAGYLDSAVPPGKRQTDEKLGIMAPPSPLSIATSSVQRLVKEEASYHRELQQQEQRIQRLEAETGPDEDGNRQYALNQERRAMEETKAVLPTLKPKISAALQKLEALLVEEGQKGDQSNVEQINAAKDAVAQAKIAVREVS
ncbi:hypothetical protein DTO164E3_8159 [Paecilomyces variotii]|nr:hypothetical protein DTO164E3_8159 [Paecilomyces variotii]KAJ9288751.1 hypothetical protein DTO021C3_3551 [Paecilomyces variotii]